MVISCFFIQLFADESSGLCLHTFVYLTCPLSSCLSVGVNQCLNYSVCYDNIGKAGTVWKSFAFFIIRCVISLKQIYCRADFLFLFFVSGDLLSDCAVDSKID